MVFYTVIMGIIDFSISRIMIGHDLRRIECPLQVTVSLLERI